MSESAIDLQIGDTMQLELVHDNRNIRHAVRAIGMVLGASVLVTSPLRNGKVIVIREGQRVIMRSFARNHAYAFSTGVLKANTQPYPYLHLSFPAQTQDVLVRRSRRIAVEMQAVARAETSPGQYGEPVAVILGDLSTNGTMMEAAEMLGTIGTKVRLAFKVPLQDIGDRELEVEGLIRSQHESDSSPGRHYFGVEFFAPDAIQLLTLRAFVYGRLLAN